MNADSLPPVDSMTPHPPGVTPHDSTLHAADRAFSQFFQSAMPAPWPEFRAPATPRIAARPDWSPQSRSRFALAASVAMILGGCWLLTAWNTPDGGPRPNIPGADLRGGNASTRPLTKELKPAPKPARLP